MSELAAALKRIEELERQVSELQNRPHQVHHHTHFVPFQGSMYQPILPQQPWSPMTPWCASVLQAIADA